MSVLRPIVLLAITLLALTFWPIAAGVPGQRPPDQTGITREIFGQYGIILADRTARWSTDEVASVQRALNAIAARFTALTGQAAESTLKQLLSGAVFYRDTASLNRIAYTLAGKVSVYDRWVAYDQTERTFYLAHEVGHLLDTRTSLWHLFMGEVSTGFAQGVGAYSDQHGVYQLGANFPRWPTPDQIRHRSDSAAEDWAESFATVLVPEFESTLRDIGAARQAVVKCRLSDWQGQAAERFAMSKAER